MEELMHNLLEIHGLLMHRPGFGKIVFNRAVCRLADGVEVAIGNGTRHQKLQHMKLVTQFLNTMTKDKKNKKSTYELAQDVFGLWLIDQRITQEGRNLGGGGGQWRN
ncbi:hypothetical protein FN846DRAFT_914632 [Sphaerosporella brunnea]|uniref:Uncharacterized protein n=1 Tax=Sphaerosporella brunnea TaxID=1250544 RepID=A0A5J5ECN4_9PEZI|nr:hypothetical protein FN846DRAFT_914632 [Sphaerosporella brunnea]